MLSFLKKIWPFSAFAAREARIMEEVSAILAQQDATWRGMSAEELAELSDGELYNAVQSRVTVGMEACESTAARLSLLNDTQCVFYVACCYETIICARGSRAFFAEEGELLLPLLGDALHRVGAWEHRALLDRFAAEWGERDGGIVAAARANAKGVKKDDPFERFDREFAALDALRGALIAYARANAAAL